MRVRLTLFGKLGARGQAVAMSALVAYVGQAIGLAQGFILIPLYVHRLGMGPYGYWLGLFGILSLLSAGDLGLGQALQARIAAASGAGRPADVSGYIWAGILIFSLLALCLGTTALSLAGWIVDRFGAPPALHESLALAFAVGACALSVRIVTDFLRGAAVSILRPAPLLAALVAGQALGLGLNIFLLLNGAGVLAIASGLALTDGFVLLASIIFLVHEHRHRALLGALPGKAHFHDALALTPFTCLSQAGTRLVRQADMTVITLILGPSSAVVYAANRKISDFLGRLISILWGSSLLPIAHLAGERSAAQAGPITRRILLGLVSLAILFSGCYVAMNAIVVHVWIGPQVASPTLLILLIATARISDHFCSICSEIHVAMGAIRFQAGWATIMSATIFVLYLLLAGSIGLSGIPLSFALGSLGFGVFLMHAARRRYGILTIPPKSMAGLAAGAVAVLSLAAMAAALASSLPPVWRWTTGIAACGLLAAGWLGFFWRQVRRDGGVPSLAGLLRG